ncbi:MAG TPA: hypothetical protein VKC99_07470 [Methyloceanibacter sp.]|nr:hypothetical protein [Methyloceanibacter sp.]
MAGNSNIIIAPTPPLPAANQFRGAEYAAAARKPPVNTGAIGITSPSALGVPGQQTFGALQGNPGSATYDPNAALPSLGNSGSAIAPDQG